AFDVDICIFPTVRCFFSLLAHGYFNTQVSGSFRNFKGITSATTVVASTLQYWYLFKLSSFLHGSIGE
ncbi:hypothetical protein, partial [Klebsiella pneumoniae]|uniref:hypothetical protein n=1 Tax=Klebsiella pneumoniae TaxID=573 RepID=UPI003013DED2